MHAISIDFQRKKVFHQLNSNPQPLDASQLLYPLSYMGVVFDRMLLDFSLLLQPTAERNLITALTCGDKLEVGG